MSIFPIKDKFKDISPLILYNLAVLEQKCIKKVSPVTHFGLKWMAEKWETIVI